MAVGLPNIEEFRRILDYVNSLTQQQIVNLWRALGESGLVAGVEFVDALVEGVRQVLVENKGLAVDAAAQFYEETQAVPVSAERLDSARVVNEDQVRSSVEWALTAQGDDALSRLSGFAQRQVYDGARGYATGAIGDVYDGGWYRFAMADACEFCKFLATRALYDWGPYGSAEAAVTVGAGASSRGSARAGESYHDHCRCIPIKADEFEPTPEMEDWGRLYQASRLAAEDSGVDISSSENNARGVLKFWREVEAGKWDVSVDADGDVRRVKRVKK